MIGLILLSGALLLLAILLALWDALAPVTGPRDEWRDCNVLTRHRDVVGIILAENYSASRLMDLAEVYDETDQVEYAALLRDLAHVQVLRARISPGRTAAPRHIRPVWKGQVAG